MSAKADRAGEAFVRLNGIRLFGDEPDSEVAAHRAARSWARALIASHDAPTAVGTALGTLHTAVVLACAELALKTGEDPEAVYKRVMERS